MNYCKRCVMPDTRPGSIFVDGVCQACLNFDRRLETDWDKRFEELERLCDKYRRDDGYYDCIVPVSGGKDSHYQVWIMKDLLGMNPLLITVSDPFTHTATGVHNLRNLCETFNCDLVSYSVSPDLFRRATKIGFEVLGEPLRFIESVIYFASFKYSVSLNIPFTIFGENSAFLYGTEKEDSPNAKRFVEAGHSASGEKLRPNLTDFWVENGLKIEELNALTLPPAELLDKVNPEPIFLSYFTDWDDERNYEIAKRYGFRDLRHEWRREGCFDDYMQIDSMAYFTHIWMKYPKFGFARATDIASRWIRKGLITREEGLKLVAKEDHKIDQKTLADFQDFMGYTPRQFWDIVEKFWNQDIFIKTDGLWKLR